MVIFLLLVIVAILLFGSSAVLGVFGLILGWIALVLAIFFGLVAAGWVFGVTIETVIYGIGVLVAVGVVARGIIASLRDPLNGALPATEEEKAETLRNERIRAAKVEAEKRFPVRPRLSRDERKRLRGR